MNSFGHNSGASNASNDRDPFEALTQKISKLPGLGKRSAQRILLHLLSNREEIMAPLIDSMQNAADEIKTCQHCFNLDTRDPCRICQNPKRDGATLCVVAHVSDLWAIERAQQFKGRYHVLGGVLSALDGIGPEQLNIQSLLARLETEEVGEIILALGATVNGQSTAHYIFDHIDTPNIKVTRLAHGMPVGGELGYLDDGTIAAALASRTAV